MVNYYVAVLDEEEWTLVNNFPLSESGASLLAKEFQHKRVKILQEIDSEHSFNVKVHPKRNISEEVSV